MRINNKKLIKIIDEVSIQKRVKEIAIELTSKFKDKKPIFIGVLNGSFIFISDLVRNLNLGKIILILVKKVTCKKLRIIYIKL